MSAIERQPGFVHAGELDRLAGDRAHAPQHFQIGPHEPPIAIGRFQVQQPQRLSRRPHQGDGHRRSIAAVEDAAAVPLAPRVENRFAGGHHACGHCAADWAEGEIAARVAAAVFDRLGDQVAVGRIDQEHVAPLRLRKDFEQAFQNVGQKDGRIERAADAVNDFQHGLQFGLRGDLEPLPRFHVADVDDQGRPADHVGHHGLARRGLARRGRTAGRILAPRRVRRCRFGAPALRPSRTLLQAVSAGGFGQRRVVVR